VSAAPEPATAVATTPEPWRSLASMHGKAHRVLAEVERSLVELRDLEAQLDRAWQAAANVPPAAPEPAAAPPATTTETKGPEPLHFASVAVGPDGEAAKVVVATFRSDGSREYREFVPSRTLVSWGKSSAAPPAGAGSEDVPLRPGEIGEAEMMDTLKQRWQQEQQRIAERIVRALAESECMPKGRPTCITCGGHAIDHHTETCPWRRAFAWVRDNPAVEAK
jgi:hypothetical protein